MRASAAFPISYFIFPAPPAPRPFQAKRHLPSPSGRHSPPISYFIFHILYFHSLRSPANHAIVHLNGGLFYGMERST
nr:MAG TPA: hypothetical protein [Bacteriophage sp.]